MKTNHGTKEFFTKIILPTLLAFLLFTITIFYIIIPSFQKNMVEKKREVIRELTNSAWSILDEFNQKVINHELSLEEAQEETKTIIKYLRYGDERKDYFWITDMRPFMVVHPYRSELNNTNLSDYEDSAGKKLFVEFVKVVKESGDGYVDYTWQWKDDPTKIVPKLSYVKGFKPWGWIIGTGIYMEDVTAEIETLTQNLIYISIIILILLAVILSFIGRQSFKFESSRQVAEKALIESEAKYRSLVEASTEGLVMMLNGEFVYANKALSEMLHFTDDDVFVQEFESLLVNNGGVNNEISSFFKELKKGILPSNQIEGKLYNKQKELIDVIFYISKISLGEKEGFTIIVKDISLHKKYEFELGENKQKFRSLIDNIKIGLFRIRFSRSGKFIEANTALQNILGLENLPTESDKGLFDLFISDEENEHFREKIITEGFLKSAVYQVRKANGEKLKVSISAILEMDDSGKPIFCDGLLEDQTEKLKFVQERENLILELQSSQHFLNEPLKQFLKPIITCNMNWEISKVAKLMSVKKYSAVIIINRENEFLGIVSDHDLRERVAAESYDPNHQVYEIMSSPIISVPESYLVYQALIYMNEKSIRHLGVKNEKNEIIGIISSEELLKIQMQSFNFLAGELDNSTTVSELIAVKGKLPGLINSLVNSGAKIERVSGLISAVFDLIVKKCIDFAIEELGEPPVKFSFLAIGSGGRKELNLSSDQDNAIVFEDVPAEEYDKTKHYFETLAEKVCGWLNQCGYVFCAGDAMAQNPKWCQPASKWKENFHQWISNSSPQDLIDASIFFDFRSVAGDESLAIDLRQFVHKASDGQAGFYTHLVKNSILHKPPIGLLGNLVLESKGEHQETFDIKTAIMPITDFARINALKNKLNSTNTIERLKELCDSGIINKTTQDELLQAYNFLMQLRVKHHLALVFQNREPDNYVNPHDLTQIEQHTLKNAFSQILGIQKKLNYDFSGEGL